jgi:hypothetical protein
MDDQETEVQRTAEGYQSNNSYSERLFAVSKQKRPFAEEGEAETRAVPPVKPIAEVQELSGSTRLQVATAIDVAYTPGKWLVEQELMHRWQKPKDQWPESRKDVYEAAAAEEWNGLCLSGGGIRSATFCLGVLQALARAGKLKQFDYLSSVSGGGYIHQWLAAWIARSKGGIDEVQKKLTPLPEGGSPERWPEPILWLRRYSNYLTPRRGIASVDTWTMIATWFRNTSLNQIVLFSFLACVLLALRVVTLPFVATQYAIRSGIVVRSCVVIIPVLLGILSIFLMYRSLLSVTKNAKSGALGDRGVFFLVVLPGMVLAWLAALEASGIIVLKIWHLPVYLMVLMVYALAMLAAMTVGGEALRYFDLLSLRRSRWKWTYKFKKPFFVAGMVLSVVACTGVSFAPAVYLALQPSTQHDEALIPRTVAMRVVGYITDAAYKRPPKVSMQQSVEATGATVNKLSMDFSTDDWKTADFDPDDPSFLLAVVLPPCFLFMQFLALHLHLGMIGRFYTESRREWLARLAGWTALIALGWIGLSAVALFGPCIMRWFLQPTTLRWAWGGLSVLVAHAVTLYAGGSSKSNGKPQPGTVLGYKALDLVGMIGAPLCIVALLLLFSGATGAAWAYTLSLPHPFLSALVLVIVVVGIFFLFGWRVDLNFFSMHGFYRDRLARCYLGASQADRIPDPFTHFDDRESSSHNDILLSELLPENFSGEYFRDSGKKYDGPFSIFCTTVNLTYGKELGWQDRKGASFAFTPLYSGYNVGWSGAQEEDRETVFAGYVPTRDYGYKKGISLAEAAAISGAALNPNMGYSSSPPLAFLMTLFNVRLGWWLANPRKPAIWPASADAPTPRFGLRYLLSELFGLADDTSKYVCLSDGGHFENMGLYELVRRRCRHIVICDAEQDEQMSFEGMGNAIARCRTDFGVEIDLALSQLRPKDDAVFAATNFLTGKIRYPMPEGTPEEKVQLYQGTITYLKSCLTGEESGDILHHKLSCPSFPHDSTMNQWFSENQFESYRRLGQFIAEQAMSSIVLRMSSD